MLVVQTIDENCPHMAAVKQLWRNHSDTLGFMPAGAFVDYARDGHLLVALEDDACVGYVLFRISRQRVTIAHFCVSDAIRKQGVARVLLQRLIEATRGHRGITLTCRRDFAAHNSWPRLGFHPIGELPGRAAKGSELVRWYLDYGHPDLFTVTEPGVLQAAIDANVFLDLVEHRNEETEALLSDWLAPLVILCYTPELATEFQRSDDRTMRRTRASQLQQFKMLSYAPESFQRADTLLRQLFSAMDSPQEESDFRHLVGAVAVEADAFVTRDGALLSRADEIFKACGLSVVRPAELIGRIDAIEREREYQRRFVAGTREVFQQRLSSVDDALVAAIQAPGETRRKVAARLNEYLADPRRFGCHKLANSDGAPLAFFVVQHDSGNDYVRMFRVCGNRRAGTVTRAVLSGLIRQAAIAGSRAVILTDTLTEPIHAACDDLGFLATNEGRIKVVLSGWEPAAAISTSLTSAGPQFDALKAALSRAKSDPFAASQVEHCIWPGKIADAELPCFIVPIRPEYAEHLVDERLASGGLFGADVDLALNSESVYYRAARPFVLKCPARVLWYVSRSDRYADSMSIRACSRIVELARGTPKQLFPRFQRLGVYEWRDVLQTANGDVTKDIMAFRFDDTELLRPIPWADFQAILKRDNVRTNLESPVSIPRATFGEIYSAAFDPSAAR